MNAKLTSASFIAFLLLGCVGTKAQPGGVPIVLQPTVKDHCALFKDTGQQVIYDNGPCSGGGGDFTGPSSAVSGNFASFNGTTGKIGQDSGVNSASFALAGAVVPVTGATSVLAANWNANTYYPVTTTGRTITVALSTGLSNNAVITVDTTFGFSVTLAPNAADQICSAVGTCGTAGASVVIAQGLKAFVWTDAANHIYINNAVPWPQLGTAQAWTAAQTFSGTVISNGYIVSSSAFDAQVGTTYTIQATDNGKIVTLNNASAIIVTVPSGLGAGFSCTVIQLGAGQVSFTTSGTTIHAYNSATKIAGQYGTAALVAYIADTFDLGGNVSP